MHGVTELRNGGVSYWYTDIGLPAYRPALPGSLDADVAIVGAGFTGLWTAYYLKRAQPDLRIVLVDGGSSIEIRLALVIFSLSWLAGAWLVAIVAAWRQVAWTFEALRSRP